ncbi:MAG: type II toxin-antitoxin system HicB family antitoxin [Janthinobacterium lividum]
MTHALQYPIVIYWSEEDQAFLAEAPDLPGCMADGATQAEVIANMAVIIEEWLEMAHELNRPIPAPRQRLQFA